jgi:hypothetical protein
MRRKGLFVCVLACALLALGGAGSASAALFVSNTVPVVPNGKSCAQPAYSKVQAAIEAAAPGATVNVCNGTYTEQLEIKQKVKLNAINGAGTATLAMPESFTLSTSACDTKTPLKNVDEISVCTSTSEDKVTITNLTIEALVPIACTPEALYGIFVAGPGTLKATNDTIIGANTTLAGDHGCQHGVAVDVGSKKAKEVGHAVLTGMNISDYEKNGPTVAEAGSTLTVSGSTITGAGPSTETAQNGFEVFGGKGIVTNSTISGNECEEGGACGPEPLTQTQSAGLLFIEPEAGSKVSGSHIQGNDMGAYYASVSNVVPAAPQVTMSKDVFTSNRYEGVLLEEGKASLGTFTINGSGNIGIDLLQANYQGSSSESSAIGGKIENQSKAAIEVSWDGESDPPGKFKYSGTFKGNASVLIDPSPNFEVIF